MRTSTVLAELKLPIIVAPMAGGPTTPQLVAAAHAAGGLGFLAAGSDTPEKLISDVRALQDHPHVRFGVNLFAPQNQVPTAADVDFLLEVLRPVYAAAGKQLVPDAEQVISATDFTNGWEEKLEFLLNIGGKDCGLKAVSVSFGCFSAAEIAALHEVGLEAWVSVTTAHEAKIAAERGADVLIVQGFHAGGHRLCWDATITPQHQPTAELIVDVLLAAPNMPLVAAGGVRTPQQVSELLSQPEVVAVQCGSAFVRCDEAGTSDFNRKLLADCADRRAGDSVTTRAFSGRFARGLATAFTKTHPDLPPTYPLLGKLLAGFRSDPRTAYCLVGSHPELLRTGTAAEIIAYLMRDFL
ncbi:MAG: nitronate monooxygenase [Corynebacterium sp.]|uniref:nitronate monooxygenase n=1 Tax=Corynebacterium sp. TaxID=1720 RepID=UPI0026DCC1F5|nr:nitronate monooxygenase [Corynebacterium sp.]MDO5097219.1 nitronate monooxygenase [Corynebacterium sp.]